VLTFNILTVQVYTEILCRGSVYESSFTISELSDQLRVELRPTATAAVDHLTRLGLLIYAGVPDRYLLPSAVRLVARYMLSNTHDTRSRNRRHKGQNPLHQ